MSVLGSLAAQSLENTDSFNVHLGPRGLSSHSSSSGAAAHLGARYSRPLLGSGSGAGHSVVLCVSGCRRHTGV